MLYKYKQENELLVNLGEPGPLLVTWVGDGVGQIDPGHSPVPQP